MPVPLSSVIGKERKKKGIREGEIEIEGKERSQASAILVKIFI